MNIEHAALPSLDEFRGEKAHEAGKTNNIDAVFFEHRLQHALEPRAVLAKYGVIDDIGRNSGGARDQQAASVWPIGKDQDDFGGVVPVFCGLDQRCHVGAAAGYKNGDAFAVHASPKIEFPVVDHAGVARCLDHVAERYRRFT